MYQLQVTLSETQLTILVSITTNTRHPIHTEIEVRQIPVNASQERHQETTKTAIDVQAEVMLQREFCEVTDWVDGAVGEVWSGPDENDSVWVAAGDRQL